MQEIQYLITICDEGSLRVQFMESRKSAKAMATIVNKALGTYLEDTYNIVLNDRLRAFEDGDGNFAKSDRLYSWYCAGHTIGCMAHKLIPIEGDVDILLCSTKSLSTIVSELPACSENFRQFNEEILSFSDEGCPLLVRGKNTVVHIVNDERVEYKIVRLTQQPLEFNLFR